MNILLIEQEEKANFIKQLFKPVEIKNERLIVNSNLEKLSLKKKIKFVQKINAILNKNACKIVLMSKNLKEDTDFINFIYANNVEIIDGKKLFKMLINDVVDYISKKQKHIKEKSEITITINQYNEFVQKIIKTLAIQYRLVKVVTSHIKEFQRLESNLLEDGIVITISNNRRKSLLNSNIILNIDFPKEVLNMYNISDDAIIVNFEENVKIKKKRFSGTIINSYMLQVKEGSNLDKLISENNFLKYEFNDICEYYYYLGGINFDDMSLKYLIKSDGEKF